MPLGDRIKRARERLRLSQQELADLLAVDRKSVSNWELGHTRPSRALMRALEGVLGPLDGTTEDLSAIAAIVRNSRELSGGQKQALLGVLEMEPHGRHSLYPAWPAAG